MSAGTEREQRPGRIEVIRERTWVDEAKTYLHEELGRDCIYWGFSTLHLALGGAAAIFLGLVAYSVFVENTGIQP